MRWRRDSAVGPGARRLGTVAVAAGSLWLVSSALAGVTDLGTAGGVNYLRIESTTGSGSGLTSLNVFCSGSDKPTGGGFTSSTNGARVFDSVPLGADRWNAVLTHTGVQELQVFAMCRAGALTYERGSERVLRGDRAKTVKAKCPAGKHVLGGGARVIGPLLGGISSSYPFDGRDRNRRPDDGWKARVYNGGTDDMEIRATAICQETQPTYVKSAFSPVEPGSTGSTTPDCDPAEHLLAVGGRISGSAAEGRLAAMRPSDESLDADSVPDDEAVLTGQNDIGATIDKTVTGFAICG